MSAPAYFFVQLQAKDMADYFARYGTPFLDVLKLYEGELLAGTLDAKTLEGDATGNWSVLLKFPNLEKARTFYSSPEYAPLLHLRLTELTDGGTVHLFEGLPPA